VPFYRPAEDSVEIEYLRRGAKNSADTRQSAVSVRRRLPLITMNCSRNSPKVATSVKFRQPCVCRNVAQELKDPEIGKLIVPIVPDEARTFGMESLFRTVGIYASGGQ